jgi:hypothetical protein
MDAPLVEMECPTPTCSEYQEHKSVIVGNVVGNMVMSTGTFVCMVCGASMNPVSE